jgi:pimeloyl-ACP methyl ester carboxylesterase
MTQTERGTGAYAEVNGLNLYYEIHGGGYPLVLLHGGILSIDSSFGSMIPILSRTHKVIAFELQGHGRTADIEREPTIDAMSDDIVAALRLLEIAKADFFGYSLGGLVSLSTAVRHPEFVNRLIVVAAHIRADGYHDEIMSPEKYPDSTRMPSEADFEEMQRDYARLAPDPEHFPIFFEKMNAMVQSIPFWTAEEIGGIKAPTLIVIGDNDFVRIDHAQEMLELIPNSRLAVLPNTNHMEVTRRTDWLIPMIEDFLNA